jgi:hypothetical protein
VCQDGAYFVDTEDNRQLLLPRCADKGEGGPFPLERVLIEELDATERNRTRATGGVLDVFEVEKVLTQFFLRHVLRGLVIVFGQLPYGPDIALLGSRGQASELEILDHTLAQWGHGNTSCTYRGLD